MERYLEAARAPQALAMTSTEYAWDMLTLTFLNPMAVLSDYSEEFGIVGLLARKWCDALHHTLCVFFPDASQMSWQSASRYARGMVEAVGAMIGRVGDLLYGMYLLSTLVFPATIFLPRVCYDVLEGVLRGWQCVAVLLLSGNDWCLFYDECLQITAMVILCGLYSRLMGRFEFRNHLSAPPPRQVVTEGLTVIRRRSNVRERNEDASLERHRGFKKNNDAQKGLRMRKSRLNVSDVPDHRTSDNDDSKMEEGHRLDYKQAEMERTSHTSLGKGNRDPYLACGLTVLAECIGRVYADETNKNKKVEPPSPRNL
ncbi:hypothetical protein PHMEG_00021851 [Phytophthora megakarya]|uniref:Uncharacterized protein n=1 Tax=Phytophthora megakarya TaxID=4795 RepID=A0A225VK56_9STRA|nr:hypothetical protein PHMEG_00021851 [Phytophthora megakarya]